jgi:Flp pilus assembly CpaE family ATPase
VYAFLPAHGESNAGGVVKQLCRSLSEDAGRSVLLADFYSRGFPVWGTPEAPQRLDRQTWGAFLTPGFPFDTLETREAHPREIHRLLDRARMQYGITCADLTDAKQVAVLEMLRAADWIFVVSGSDAASLEMAKYKAEWLRSIDLEANSGLLLHRVPGGVSAPEAEDITGLPVCALVDRTEELNRLAAWLAAPRA